MKSVDLFGNTQWSHGHLPYEGHCVSLSSLAQPFEYKVRNGKGKGKGKAVPLQAWSGPEGSRKLSFPDFMTAAQDCGKVVSLTHRQPLPPGNTPGTHFC